MKLNFSKMHGLGNDFMVVDAVNQRVKFTAEQIKQLSRRHHGVGFDQLLIIAPPRDATHDFVYQIFNASGDEVSQCGNGARCVARFINDKKLSDQETLRLATRSRIVTVNKVTNHDYTVDMGVPEFTPSKIPFLVNEKQKIYPIKIDNYSLQAIVLSMGNPHMVIIDALDDNTIDVLGPKLMKHPLFPEGVNVGFLKIIDAKTLNLRVFERGVGETQACGSGACAAMVAGRILGELDANVKVYVRGGCLTVFWAGEGIVEQTGPATAVYDAVLSEGLLPK